MHPTFRRWLTTSFPAFIFFLLTLSALSLSAVTLEELRREAKLTPEQFALHFSHFRFEFAAQVQSPETFLAREAGDCDDYATLADAVLREKGYTPRLVAIRMKRVVHVVCYVQETGSYLDYNCRAKGTGTVASGSSLEEIADHVAKEFSAPWTSVSEFTYSAGLKRLVRTVLAKDAHRKPAWVRSVTARVSAIF